MTLPRSRQILVSQSILAAFLLVQIGLSTNAHAFLAGDVFWAGGGCDSACGVFDITGGGTITAGDIIGTTQPSPGQIAWSTDFETLYMTEFDTDRVVAISNAGVVTTFASGINGATGLLRLSDGTLLAVSYYDGAVYDITAGGDFSLAIGFATGFNAPRNLLQLANGQILLADQGVESAFNITNGGDFTGAVAFADGFTEGPYDLVQDAAGQIYASTRGPVFNITSGGDFSSATSFAFGVNFIGLTIDGEQRLLASEFNTGDVFDITNGGDFTAAGAFAQGIPAFGDTSLDAIPDAVVLPPTPRVPALGSNTLVLLVMCLGGLGVQMASKSNRTR